MRPRGPSFPLAERGKGRAELEYLIHARGMYDAGSETLRAVSGLRVRDGRIAEIAAFDALRARHPDLDALDWADSWLFPGLINTHVHLEFSATDTARQDFLEGTPGTRLLQAAHAGSSLLRSGVTTARDAGSSWGLLDLRHPQAARLVALPRLQLAGPPLTVTGGHLHFLGEETDTREDMVRQVRIRQKRGCDAVKLIVTGGQMTPGSLPERVSLTQEEIAAAVAEAHLLGLPTFAHCLTTEGFVRCMQGGVDCIEHIACFVRCRENGLLERVYEPARMEAFRGQARRFMMGLSAGYHQLDAVREGRLPCTARESFLLEQEERMFAIFGACCELGLEPVCGTDAGTGGTRFDETWLELALMVERAGRTNAEAIRSATRSAAACLGLEGETGELRTGLSADIVALRENPLEEIRAYGRARGVICRGEVVRPPET